MADYILPELSMEAEQQSPHSARESCHSPLTSPLDYYHGMTDDELTLPSDHARRTSTHSSISSFPVSVIQPSEYGGGGGGALGSSKPRYGQPMRTHSSDRFARNVSTQVDQGIGSIFRHPSSVEEIQMKDDDTESLLIRSHRRKGSHLSARSHGRILSPLSSASKRQSYSSHSSPVKGSKLRKEFPLVLLHCSILPPASAAMPNDYDSELYAALLPEEYRARWNTLQDKLADPEMKTRGILIPHPQEDYDLLEERLLESLGLEAPRIQGSHYFHDDKSSGDSGFESGSQLGDDSSDEALQHGRCPDCGKCLHLPPEGEQKWEIKVYAANGLMRAGAWAAAWRDMEKVDVEISLAMPDDVRREVNSRLEVLRSVHQDSEGGSSADQDTTFQEKEMDEATRHKSDSHSDASHEHTMPSSSSPNRSRSLDTARQKRPNLHFFLDGKNILIALLSILVIFHAITGGSNAGLPIAFDPPVTETSTSQKPERRSSASITTSPSDLDSVSVSVSTQTSDIPPLSVQEILPSVAVPAPVDDSEPSTIITSTRDPSSLDVGTDDDLATVVQQSLESTAVPVSHPESESEPSVSVTAGTPDLASIGIETGENPYSTPDVQEFSLPSATAVVAGSDEYNPESTINALPEPPLIQQVLVQPASSQESQCENPALMQMERNE